MQDALPITADGPAGFEPKGRIREFDDLGANRDALPSRVVSGGDRAGRWGVGGADDFDLQDAESQRALPAHAETLLELLPKPG